MRSRKPTRIENETPELMPDPEAVDKLSVFFDSLGQDREASVSLYAVDPQNRLRRSFLLTLPGVSSLSGPDFMAQVLERHGAGEYYVESRDPLSGKIGLQQRFEVGGIVKRTGSVLPPLLPPASSPATSGAQAAPELVALLSRQTALLDSIANRPAPSLFGGLDIPEVIGAVTAALVSLRKIAEPVQPPAAAPASDPLAGLELVLKGVELARELRDDAAAGSEEGLLGVFRELLRSPLLERALEAQAPAPRKRIAAQSSPKPASEVPAMSPAQAPETPAAAGPIPPATLRRYLSALVTYAERDSDPALYAELALDNVSEDVLRSLVDRPDALEAAIALDPRVGEHRDWFAELLGAVRAALAEDAPPAPAVNGSGAADVVS